MKTSWQEKILTAYPPLSQNIQTDVAIIGGGIAGITTAYALARAGKRVAVIEKGTLGTSSHTALTTAMITVQVDTKLPDLCKIFGEKQGLLVWQSGKDAIDSMEKIIREEGIECEFSRVPAYVFANTQGQKQSIKHEASLAREHGFSIAFSETSGDLPFENVGYYRLDDQAKFHPLKYCDGLRRAAEKYGAQFFEETEATSLEGDSLVSVITKGNNKITADWAIIATYNPFNKPKELYGKKGVYLSYMQAVEIPKNFLNPGLYVSSDNPYHYFRIDEMTGLHDRMIIGGEDHRVEININPEKNYKALETYAKKILGDQSFTFTERWRGGIIETWDGLPFIGQYSKHYPNRLVATGFSGNGMTYSMIAAQILADHIMGHTNPCRELYHPRRGYSFTAMYIKGRDYMTEFFGGIVKNLFRRS